MGTIIQLIDEQFGRILLGAALIATLGVSMQNSPLVLEQISQADKDRPVQVPLNAAKLPTAVKELYFMQPGQGYAGSNDHFIFVPEKKMVEFKPVTLDVPTSNVQPPPQLLPDPGPMLETTGKLPRFGDEFPPLKLEDPKSKDPGAAPVPKP
jgi:hypothetical protein